MEDSMTIMAPERPAPACRTGPRARLAQRRELARQDRLVGRLVELRDIAELTERAGRLIAAGWIQHSWYSYRRQDESPGPAGRSPIAGACLVGAIVQAGGGPGTFNSQLVQRTLDLTWSTLYGVAGDSLAWCPAPSVRTSRLHDLTRWNDRPARTRSEVADLLTATGAEAGRLSGLIQQQRLAAVSG
jgi:hypothetical protein